MKSSILGENLGENQNSGCKNGYKNRSTAPVFFVFGVAKWHALVTLAEWQSACH
jgi:hypothetical protein